MQNPNFAYNPYPYQNVNPYMERLTNLQQYQQALQQPQIQPAQQPAVISRIVDNFDSITAQDVPMSGQAVFIKSDGSEIQIRSWNNTGLIDKTTYKAILATETPNTDKLPQNELESKFDPLNELTEGIMKRFDNLDKQLSDFGKCLTTAKQVSRKKEVDAE